VTRERRLEIVEQKRLAVLPYIRDLLDLVGTLEKVRIKMDVSFASCPCCNKRTYTNWPQKLVADDITNIQRQVSTLAREARIISSQ
jgi:hypothetical protein